MFSSFISLFGKDIKKLLKPWLMTTDLALDSIPPHVQKQLYELLPKQPEEKEKLRQELCGFFKPLQQNFDLIYEGLIIEAAQTRFERHKFYQEPSIIHRLQKVERCISDNAKNEEKGYEFVENEDSETKYYKRLLIVEREKLKAAIQTAEAHFSHYNFDVEPVIATRRNNVFLAIYNLKLSIDPLLDVDVKTHCFALMKAKFNALSASIQAAKEHFNKYDFDAESVIATRCDNVALAIQNLATQNINGLDSDAKTHCLALMNAKLDVLNASIHAAEAHFNKYNFDAESVIVTRRISTITARRNSVALAIQNIGGLDPDTKTHCLALMNAKLNALDTTLAQLQAQELAEQLKLKQEGLAAAAQQQALIQRQQSPTLRPITPTRQSPTIRPVLVTHPSPTMRPMLTTTHPSPTIRPIPITNQSPAARPITSQYDNARVEQLMNIPSYRLTQEQIFRVCDHMGM